VVSFVKDYSIPNQALPSGSRLKVTFMKHLLRTVFLVIASLFAVQVVYACTIGFPTVTLTCTSKSSNQPISTTISGAPRSETDIDLMLQGANKSLADIAPNCREDLSTLQPILKTHYTEWNIIYRSSGNSWGLVFEAYSSIRESELQQRYNALVFCRYEDYKRDGDWLVSIHRIRDYCIEVACMPTQFSHILFIVHLFSHLTVATFLYVTIYILFTILLITWTAYWNGKKPRKSIRRALILVGLLSLIYACASLPLLDFAIIPHLECV
jgi:hypothetical protein